MTHTVGLPGAPRPSEEGSLGWARAQTLSQSEGLGRLRRMDNATATFEPHRQRLYGIAYRMLGSRADAEDMVQEAYVRWHGADDEIARPKRGWSPPRRGSASTGCARRAPSAKPTSGRGCPNRSPAQARAAGRCARASSRPTCRSPSWWCWNDWRPKSAPRSCCTRSSTAATPTSPAFSARARPLAARSSVARASASSRTGRASR